MKQSERIEQLEREVKELRIRLGIMGSKPLTRHEPIDSGREMAALKYRTLVGVIHGMARGLI